MLKPLSDRVVVEPPEEGPDEKNGIVLPAVHRGRNRTARVVAVGPGRYTDKGRFVPMSVSVGDMVVCPEYHEDEVTVDGERYWIFREEKIVAIEGESNADQNN